MGVAGLWCKDAAGREEEKSWRRNPSTLRASPSLHRAAAASTGE